MTNKLAETCSISNQVTPSRVCNSHLSNDSDLVQSKHLKGQLDPPVGNITFFDHQGGQFDPPVNNVNFLDH